MATEIKIHELPSGAEPASESSALHNNSDTACTKAVSAHTGAVQTSIQASLPPGGLPSGFHPQPGPPPPCSHRTLSFRTAAGTSNSKIQLAVSFPLSQLDLIYHRQGPCTPFHTPPESDTGTFRDPVHVGGPVELWETHLTVMQVQLWSTCSFTWPTDSPPAARQCSGYGEHCSDKDRWGAPLQSRIWWGRITLNRWLCKWCDYNWGNIVKKKSVVEQGCKITELDDLITGAPNFKRSPEAVMGFRGGSGKKSGDEPRASLRGMTTHGLIPTTGGTVTTEPFKNDKYVNYVDMWKDIKRVYMDWTFFS